MEKEIKVEDIIDVLRGLKKTDQLFKPLKKLKSALEKINSNNISSEVTTKIIIFHFGLGCQMDWQIITSFMDNKKKPPNCIIPGKPYCIIQFDNDFDSQRYISQMKFLTKNIYYLQINYKQMKRIIIGMYWKGQNQLDIVQNIPNCPSKYQNNLIPGLFNFDNFLTNQQEFLILKQIDSGIWNKLNNRRVQHYGFQFKYGKNGIDKQSGQTPLLPLWTKIIFQKIKIILPQIFDKNKGQFDQLTINDYFAGDGIPSHFDTHSPFDMLSGIVMDFVKYDNQQQYVYLSPKSIAVFSGQARYAWTHGIACRKLDKVDKILTHRSRRVSLTFRKIKYKPCECKFYFYCDSQGYDQNTMKKKNWLLEKYTHNENVNKLKKLKSPQIEQKFVYQAYNAFGHNFDNQFIKQIQNYLSKQTQPCDLVLDVGCGNGTYKRIINPQSHYFGIQKCKTMKGEPKQERLYMDGLALSFKNQSFDKVILIAVLHHFSSKENRIKCLKQIYKVLKFGGYLYLSVFSYQIKQHIYSNQDILLDYCLPYHKMIDQNGQQKQKPKVTMKGNIYTRYYHLFLEEQLRQLLTFSGFNVQELLYDEQNIIVKAIKKQ